MDEFSKRYRNNENVVYTIKTQGKSKTKGMKEEKIMKKLLAMLMCLLCIHISANAEKVTLRVLSDYKASWEFEFEQQNPDIAVRHYDLPVDAQAYQTLLMTNNEYDLYEIAIGPVYRALRDKGFISEIQSEVVQNFMHSTYPYIHDTLTLEGKVYAVPCPQEEQMTENVTLGMWAYDGAAWNAECAQEAPALTYSDLLSRSIEWQENKSDSDYLFCSASPGEDGLGTHILIAYVAQYESKEEPLSFDTDIFREVMALLKIYNEQYDAEDERPALIMPYSGNLIENSACGYTWMNPPTFFKSDAPFIQAHTWVYAINSNSKHKKEALRYLETALEKQNEISLFMMNPQHTKEIKEGKNILVTNQTANMAKDVLQKVSVNLYSNFLGGDHYFAMMDYVQQYLSGRLDIDRLIDKLDARASLVFLEN